MTNELRLQVPVCNSGYQSCRMMYPGPVQWTQSDNGLVGRYRSIYSDFRVMELAEEPSRDWPFGRYLERTYSINLFGGGIPWQWRLLLLCPECSAKERRHAVG